MKRQALDIAVFHMVDFSAERLRKEAEALHQVIYP